MKISITIFIASLILASLTKIGDCDPCNRTHNPSRLTLLKSNATLYGVVVRDYYAFDGDYHMNIRIKELDMLSENNFKYEDSCMVGEINCAKTSILPICWFHKNRVTIPKVGDSIEITGNYVFDKVHGLMEIHPITKLTVLQ